MTTETKSLLEADWAYWSKLKKEGKTDSEEFPEADELREERRDGVE